MRSLAKRWVLAVEDASTKKGTLASIWESPFLAEARYRKHEQEIDTFQSCVPWGIMCGRHCSEASAAAALSRGEIEEVSNTTGRGPALLYRTVDVQCTREFVRLAPVAIPLAKVFFPVPAMPTINNKIDKFDMSTRFCVWRALAPISKNKNYKYMVK